MPPLRPRSIFPAFGVALALLVAIQVEDLLPVASHSPDAATPPADGPVLAPAQADSSPIEVVRVGRGGAGPHSLVTDTAIYLTIQAYAAFDAPAAEIVWRVTPPAGFELPADAVLSGPVLDVRLVRRAGNPTGEGGPLTLTLRVENAEGETASLRWRQDELDRLRQEYVDLERRVVPPRDAFIDAPTFAARYAEQYPGWTFERVNHSLNPGTGRRYPYLMISERLLATLAALEQQRGTIYVASVYRNPYRQWVVNRPVGESHHQYGRAADLGVPVSAAGVSTPADWLTLAREALLAGGHWIEPMLLTGINTNGCHLHVDVRPEGVVSQVVRLHGRVLAEDGRTPVPGARLDLAGMPAVTDGQGRFSITHVLTPRRHLLEALTPSGALWTQALYLQGGVNEVVVRLAPGLAQRSAPLLVIRAVREPVATGDRPVMVAVTNEGNATARNLRWAAMSVTSGPEVVDVEPSTLGTLAPGETAMVQVTTRAGGGPRELGFRLLATYGDLRGKERTVALAVGADRLGPRLASRGDKGAKGAEDDGANQPDEAPAEPEPASVLPGMEPTPTAPESSPGTSGSSPPPADSGAP